MYGNFPYDLHVNGRSGGLQNADGLIMVNADAIVPIDGQNLVVFFEAGNIGGTSGRNATYENAFIVVYVWRGTKATWKEM